MTWAVYRLADRTGIEHHARERREREELEGVKLAVLTEEVGEVARGLLDRAALLDLKAELVQVAAVAVAWVEAIDTELGGAS